MMMMMSILTSLALIVVAATWRCTSAFIVLYPQASVLQLTSSLSVPLVELPPMRSLFFDWGFQMNYVFPSQLSSFYNAPIWPWQSRTLSLLPANKTNNERQHQYQQQQQPQPHHHRNDFTAGELYGGLQRLLAHYGFDRSCLALSVCELAQQPLMGAEANVFATLLHFALSPLLHMGFAATTEHAVRAAFELAERRGRVGGDCRCAYANCTRNPLDLISKVLIG